MKNSSKRNRPPLSPELLRTYWRLVVPEGLRRYHVRGRYGWPAAKWPEGGWKELDSYMIQRHLDGSGRQVAARWSLVDDAWTSHAVIDLDSPLKGMRRAYLRQSPGLVHEADDEMREKLRRVLDALGRPPHVVIRSSSSRGLHIYLFLDRPYPAVDVNRVLCTRLAAAGLEPDGDVVDKIFPANQALRLPLGPTSCILEHDGDRIATLTPVAAQEKPLPPLAEVVDEYAELGWGHPPPGAFTLLRDVPRSILELDRLARERRIGLEQLELPSPRGVLVEEERWGGGGGGPEPAPPPRAGSTAPGRAGVFVADHPAQQGQRHRQTRALVRRLRLDGYTFDAAMDEVRAWLELSAREGTSKDLKGATPAQIEQYVRDAAGAWAWFDTHPHALKPAPRPFVALSKVLGSPRRQPPHLSSSTRTPPSWWDRDAALRAVTPADIAQLALVTNDWLRRKLGVLVGLLRIAEEANGGQLDNITVCAKIFDRIIGGRPPPAHVYEPGREDEGPRAVLLVAARRAGFLVCVDRGIKTVRASMFRATLPPARRP